MLLDGKLEKQHQLIVHPKIQQKKVLDYYYTNGLNIVKETDDGYYVTVKERHSYERYKDDLIILETLDENGFPPDNKYYNKKGD